VFLKDSSFIKQLNSIYPDMDTPHYQALLSSLTELVD